MKIIKFLFISVALLSAVACNKDDDDNGSSDLVGTWALTTLDYEGTSSTTVAGQTFSSDFMGTARDISATVQFKSDGTYISMGSYTIDLSYEFSGQTFSQPVVLENFLGTGTYSLDGNTLTTTDDQSNETAVTEITTLNSDNLIIDIMTEQITNQSGTTSNYTIDGNYTFDRQ